MIGRRLLVFPLVLFAGAAAAAVASATDLEPAWRLAFCAAIEVPAVGVGLWYVLGADTGVSPSVLFREAALASARLGIPVATVLVVVVVVTAATRGRTSAAVAFGGALGVNVFVGWSLAWVFRWTRAYGLYGQRADVSAQESVDAQRFELMHVRAQAESARAHDRYVEIAGEVRTHEVLLSETAPHRIIRHLKLRWRLLKHARMMYRAERDAAAAEHLAREAAQQSEVEALSG